MFFGDNLLFFDIAIAKLLLIATCVIGAIGSPFIIFEVNWNLY